jgi:predicted ATPase/Tfp pilus assembly protein PilF
LSRHADDEDIHAGATTVAFRVLGPVEVRRDGSTLQIGGPRQRALLALLLVNRERVISADELVEELWSGEPPDGALTTIRSYMSRLRGVLGDAAPISGTSAGYAITFDPDDLDASVFERHVVAGDEAIRSANLTTAREHYAAALGHWRGRPFADLSDDGLLRIEADRLEERRLHALEERLAADIALRDGSSVVDELEDMVRRHPYRERLWRLLMLALYQAGRQVDALDAYQRARRMLDEQLGLEPSPDLVELEGEILRHEVPLPATVGYSESLPAPVSAFVGRKRELDRIHELLTVNRLVTLTGVGGVGKTRLAIAVAERRREEAGERIVFADLSQVNQSGVPRAVSGAFSQREMAARDLGELVSSAVGTSPTLLVLDNCEHLLDAIPALAADLLRRSPPLRILATSRSPIGLDGEREEQVAPLELPPPDATGSIAASSEAVQLLLDRLQVSMGHELADADLAQAAQICRDLDGIPLAIELAAARSKALSLAEIAARLDDRFRFLVSWRRVTTARHQTLRQAMDWSHDLLTADEQRLLACLSVFAGGFDVAAVAAVATGNDHERATDLLARLVDASLVVADTRRSSTRYRVLETVRQYAAERLNERGETEPARRRHAQHFAALATTAEPELTGAQQTEWFGRLDDEHANLLAALSYLQQSGGDDARLLECTVSLTRFWYVRGHLAEARERLTAAADAAAEAPAGLRRRALTAAASIALLQGDYGASVRFAEDSLRAAQETGEERLIANGLSNLGAIALAAGEHERARSLLEEAVSRARRIDDTRIAALALNNLGDHALTVGDYERAEPLFNESLAILRARGDTANVARSLFNLGAVALELGRLEEAEPRLRESLELSRHAGDKEDMCWCLLGTAALAGARDLSERAATLCGAASALLGQIGAAFKPFERSLYDRTTARARELMGEMAFNAAHRRGEEMSLDAALEFAATA